VLLGSACGVMVGTVAYLWRGEALLALTIGVSILLAVFMAGRLGLSIPTLLHAIRGGLEDRGGADHVADRHHHIALLLQRRGHTTVNSRKS
jgi:hypothetical protein